MHGSMNMSIKLNLMDAKEIRLEDLGMDRIHLASDSTAVVNTVMNTLRF
jgi:hypothetical protein